MNRDKIPNRLKRIRKANKTLNINIVDEREQKNILSSFFDIDRH